MGTLSGGGKQVSRRAAAWSAPTPAWASRSVRTAWSRRAPSSRRHQGLVAGPGRRPADDQAVELSGADNCSSAATPSPAPRGDPVAGPGLELNAPCTQTSRQASMARSAGRVTAIVIVGVGAVVAVVARRARPAPPGWPAARPAPGAPLACRGREVTLTTEQAENAALIVALVRPARDARPRRVDRARDGVPGVEDLQRRARRPRLARALPAAPVAGLGHPRGDPRPRLLDQHVLRRPRPGRGVRGDAHHRGRSGGPALRLPRGVRRPRGRRPRARLRPDRRDPGWPLLVRDPHRRRRGVRRPRRRGADGARVGGARGAGQRVRRALHGRIRPGWR